MARRKEPVDVVVVGGGLSGMYAASVVAAAGKSVALVEARERVGGRNLSEWVGSERLDLGGQWIGPTQPRINKLIDELGLTRAAQYDRGNNLLLIGGKVRPYKGTVPRLSLVALLQTQRVLSAIDRMRKEIPLERPWQAREARRWDGLSVEAWAGRKIRSKAGRSLLFSTVRAIFCCEPSEISLLYFLFYVHSGGGLMKLAEVEGGFQQDRIAGGAQQISERLAERLGPSVHLGAAVRAIVQADDGVTVETATASHRGRHVIVATAPTLAGRIAYSPELPPARDQLMQRMPQGSSIKFLASYERAFWRDKGFSGQVVSDVGPVHLLFDDGADDDAAGTPGTLVGFILGDEGRRWGAADATARRRAVLEALTRWFGAEAYRPIHYVDKDWNADPWTRGCPVGLMPCGAMTTCGSALREPAGRIHWAGTETAREAVGFMEGAIEAGERAAGEVLARL